MSRYLTATYIPELIRQCMQRSALKGTTFTETFPKTAVEAPTITWSIAHRVLGKEGKEHLKPRPRPMNNPRVDTIYFGQWCTVIYQFDIFAPSDQEANKVMEEFERFILESTPTLVKAGVHEIIFEEQLKDEFIDMPSDTSVRSLRYMVIFDLIYPIKYSRIRDIEILLHMSPYQDILTMTRGSSSVDYLPSTEVIDSQTVDLRISSIIGISNEEVISEDDYYYLKDVDYTFIKDDTTGRLGILWTSGGREPDEGTDYYIAYIKRTETIDTSILKTL